MFDYPYQLTIDHFIDTFQPKFPKLKFVMHPDDDTITISKNNTLLATAYFKPDQFDNLILTQDLYNTDIHTHNDLIQLRHALLNFNRGFAEVKTILN